MQDYLTIKETGSHEIIIKKSRFIASFARAENETEAKQFIDTIKTQNRDATHNCSAWIMGEDDQMQRANDDGEPSGTAGIPMLEALKLMKLKNVVVVVTRYFGGIKLGAGGLIRAYSNSVSQGALAIGIVERKLQAVVSFEIPYDRLGEIDNFLKKKNIYIANRQFAVNVTLTIYIDKTDIESLENQLTDLLQGRVSFTTDTNRYQEIPVKDTNLHDFEQK